MNSKRNSYNLYKKFSYLILFSLMLTPSFRINRLPAIRIDELLLLILFIYLFFNLFTTTGNYVVINKHQKLLLFCMIIVPLSILNGFLNDYPTSIYDMNQLIRFGKYLLIYTVGLSFISLSENKNKDIYEMYDYILKISSILTIVIIQQYFDLFNLNNIYISYIAPTQYETLITGYQWPRPVGLTGNPNELGFIMTMTSWLALYLLLYSNKKLKYSFYLLLSFVSLVVTLSRTALVSFIIGSIFLIFIYAKKKYTLVGFIKNKNVIFITIVLIIMSLLAMNIEPLYDKFFFRFFALFNIMSDTSWISRFDSWGNNVAIFLEHPILGVGPLRRSPVIIGGDNEWLVLLRSYGLLGTLALIFTYLIPCIKYRKNDSNGLNYAFIIGASFYMIPAALFHSLILMPLFIMILSLKHDSEDIILINSSLIPRFYKKHIKKTK